MKNELDLKVQEYILKLSYQIIINIYQNIITRPKNNKYYINNIRRRTLA